jgi:PAS domain-containing protein
VHVVCSYCRKDMGRKPPLNDGSLTHAMCRECDAYFAEQWRGLSFGDYVERFPYPVVLVEAEGRVVAMNRPACGFLGRDPREVVGLLGGEAMECAYARLPGGCGKTAHCAACAIRNTVTATHRTGRLQVRVPATLRRRDGSAHDLLVSTTLEGQVVKVVIELAPVPARPAPARAS